MFRRLSLAPLVITVFSTGAVRRHSTWPSSPSSFRDKLKSKPSNCQPAPANCQPSPALRTLVSNGGDSLYQSPATDTTSAIRDTSSDAASRDPDEDCRCRPGGGVSGTSHTDDCCISTQDIVYPLFQSLWPRLDALTIIYRGVEKTIFQQKMKS